MVSPMKDKTVLIGAILTTQDSEEDQPLMSVILDSLILMLLCGLKLLENQMVLVTPLLKDMTLCATLQIASLHLQRLVLGLQNSL